MKKAIKKVIEKLFYKQEEIHKNLNGIGLKNGYILPDWYNKIRDRLGINYSNEKEFQKNLTEVLDEMEQEGLVKVDRKRGPRNKWVIRITLEGIKKIIMK